MYFCFSKIQLFDFALFLILIFESTHLIVSRSIEKNNLQKSNRKIIQGDILERNKVPTFTNRNVDKKVNKRILLFIL